MISANRAYALGFLGTSKPDLSGIYYLGPLNGNLLETARDLNDASQVVAVMLVIITLGVAIDGLIFAPVERRLREQWGLVTE